MSFPACFPSPYHFWYLSKSAYWKRRAFNLKPQVSGFSRLSFIKTPAKWVNQSGWPYCSVSCRAIFLSPSHVVDCDSFCFPRLGSKTWALRKNVKYFNVSPIPLFSRFFAIHRFPAIFLPSCLTYESSCESFPSKNKLSGKNCAAAGLNFQQPEILKRFRAIWLFSCRLSFKIIFNSFRG